MRMLGLVITVAILGVLALAAGAAFAITTLTPVSCAP